MSAGAVLLPTTDVCPPCSFCDTTSCSGVGTCVSSTSSCVCPTGYTGAYCQIAPGCSGPLDGRGVCCAGANSILDVNSQCCAGVAPVLAFNGTCCPGGNVNPCGVCGGPPSAVLSATGACCVNGVTDSSGLCCPSGVLDSFGVCDGLDTMGSENVGLSLSVPPSLNSGNVNDPASAGRVAFDGALESYTATSLNRSSSTVSVSSVAIVSRRRLANGRGLTQTLAATVNLAPYGGPNAAPQYQLSAALTGSSSNPLVTVQGVTSTAAAAVCGNGVCEAGERPNPSQSIVGCAVDCPYPVTACPAPNGAVCNGVGLCVSGACVCSPAQGYGGVDCSVCAAGFAAGVSAGSCVRVEAIRAVVLPPSPANYTGAIVGGVVGGTCGVLLILGAVAVYAKMKRGGKVSPKVAPVLSPKEHVYRSPVHVRPVGGVFAPSAPAGAPVDGDKEAYEV